MGQVASYIVLKWGAFFYFSIWDETQDNPLKHVTGGNSGFLFGEVGQGLFLTDAP